MLINNINKIYIAIHSINYEHYIFLIITHTEVYIKEQYAIKF